MALNVIMLGPPGAGKGTQAERFAVSRGIPRISTGEMLRQAAYEGTETGRRARVVMDRGELVGDDVMIGIVEERLGRQDAVSGFVLDGFPRTVGQARALDGLVDGRGALIVADIVVPETELIRRLASRMVCEACGTNAAAQAAVGDPCRRCGGRLAKRPDDDLGVVQERLKVYQRQTAPLVDYYKTRPTFRSVNGAQDTERVASDLAAAIEAAALDAAGLGVRP